VDIVDEAMAAILAAGASSSCNVAGDGVNAHIAPLPSPVSKFPVFQIGQRRNLVRPERLTRISPMPPIKFSSRPPDQFVLIRAIRV
jgi:hypothetical protein